MTVDLYVILSAAGLTAAIFYSIITIFILRAFHFHKKESERFTPPVTLLKPVHGVETATYENLKSFISQDYPEFQVLFGVSSKEDPVVEILSHLIKEFPSIPIDIIFVEHQTGENKKVNSLIAMLPHAQYSILVVSDSDIFVEPHYLKNIIPPFNTREIGMVTCPYRVKQVESLAQKLEGTAINADLMPSVLVASTLGPIRFGLGATIAVRREALNDMGGFESLAPYLADDNQLGKQIAKNGWKIKLSEYVVDVTLPAIKFRHFFTHQLRWAKTYRVCQPVGYLFSVITQWLPFSVTLLILTHGAAWAFFLSIFAISARLISVSTANRYLKTQIITSFPLLMINDFFKFLFWCMAFMGSKVEWQGRYYKVNSDGKMKEINC